MRTADRVLADGIRPHRFNSLSRPDPRVKDIVAAQQPAFTESIVNFLRFCPILVADNVSAYVRERDSVILEDFPSLAPPWPAFWVEYRSGGGTERRGVLVVDATGNDRNDDGAFAVRVVHGRRTFNGDGYGWEVCAEDRQAWPCATIQALDQITGEQR